MKLLFIARVKLWKSEPTSFGSLKQERSKVIVPVWARDRDEAELIVRKHFHEESGAPGDFVRVEGVRLHEALGEMP